MLAVTLTRAMNGKAAQDHRLVADRVTRPATADPKATGHVVTAITINHNGNSTSKSAFAGTPWRIVEKP
jgi:hypothetical protein